MNKFLTTLALTVSLLFGGGVVLSAPASAADCELGTGCVAPDPCDQLGGCDPVPCTQLGGCASNLGGGPGGAAPAAEQTANDYRAQVIALTADLAASKAEAARLKAHADRLATTIQRLRAKIRTLR